MWLQCYPRTLFAIINHSGSGVISQQEITMFYRALKISYEDLEEVSEKSYSTMTANDDAYHVYKLSFLNYLLGQHHNGPGQSLFGTVSCEMEDGWLPGQYIKGRLDTRRKSIVF